MNTHLFLFGSGPPFSDRLARQYSKLLAHGKVAVLYIDRVGSEEYLPKYTKEIGLDSSAVHYLSLKHTYEEEEVEQLRTCNGVIIGGGDTVAYREYIVETEVAPILSELFSKGVPIAGFSAGALIAPEHCVISPNDNEKQVQLFRKGLGLVRDVIIAAHFLEWGEEEPLKKGIAHTGVSCGYGIAEGSGLYIRNNHLVSTEGYIQIERGSS